MSLRTDQLRLCKAANEHELTSPAASPLASPPPTFHHVQLVLLPLNSSRWKVRALTTSPRIRLTLSCLHSLFRHHRQGLRPVRVRHLGQPVHRPHEEQRGQAEGHWKAPRHGLYVVPTLRARTPSRACATTSGAQARALTRPPHSTDSGEPGDTLNFAEYVERNLRLYQIRCVFPRVASCCPHAPELTPRVPQQPPSPPPLLCRFVDASPARQLAPFAKAVLGQPPSRRLRPNQRPGGALLDRLPGHPRHRPLRRTRIRRLLRPQYDG